MGTGGRWTDDGGGGGGGGGDGGGDDDGYVWMDVNTLDGTARAWRDDARYGL